MRELDNKRSKEIKRRFQFIEKANSEDVAMYKQIREEAIFFAEFLARRCPESREFSVALTSLEDSVMWAINSIARNKPNDG